MGCESISTKGKIAVSVANVLEKSVDELDSLDGERDGKISLLDLSKKMPDRIYYPSPSCEYQSGDNSNIGIVLIDNGDGVLSEKDILIIQAPLDTGVGGHDYGASFYAQYYAYPRKSIYGIEIRNGGRVTVAHEMTAWLAGINHETLVSSNPRITLFSDFKKHGDQIIRRVLNKSSK